MKALARFLMIVALMVSIGAHWGVLQVVAWVNMAKVYSAEKGLVEGLKETFDGEHPCAMCKKISTQKDGEPGQKLPVTIVGQSNLIKWLSVEHHIMMPQPCWDEGETVVQRDAHLPCFSGWDAGPPVPPPKIAA